MNHINETEIVVFKDERVFTYSDTESDHDYPRDDSEIVYENLLPPEIDIYQPTAWDQIPDKRYRNQPQYWNWTAWEMNDDDIN
jgi:hypothetical protein